MPKQLSAAIITNVVKDYVNAEDTAHAIMLDGEWGCGKTYLWKRTIAPAIGEQRCLYISLYGLASFEDIDNALFRELTFLGSTDSGGTLSDMLNKSSAGIGDVRLGGIGSLVAYALQQWKKRTIKHSDKGLICFDDLERWSGPPHTVLSYINRFCEREGQKVLVIGNYKAFMSQVGDAVGTSGFRKTIRFKYKLQIPAEHVLEVAASSCSWFPPDASTYLSEILEAHKLRLTSFIKRFRIHNIRTVATTLHYFLVTQQANKALFRNAKLQAVAFLESLLATMVLLNTEEPDHGLRDILEDPDCDDHTPLLKGFASLQNALGKTEFEQLTRCAIYSQSRVGITSLVSRGTYIAEEFQTTLQQWEALDAYYSYLDETHFYSLDDAQAHDLTKKVTEGVLQRREVTDASLLLSLLDRLLQDIREKAISTDESELLESFRRLFEELVKNGDLEPGDTSVAVSIVNIPSQFAEAIQSLLDQHKSANRQLGARRFWDSLASQSEPEDVAALVALNREEPLFIAPTQVILSRVEALSNPSLAALLSALADRLDAKSAASAREAESEAASQVAAALMEKYGSLVGVREANLRRLSTLLATDGATR
ncbi:KAP family P-loop domain protein (plasmid) [Thioflavicoccus mobilis 8321]|uniref:KAP family P-loop domain protein n=1 Tax=Thioflavicoccus mobilis 8321 TaxID=765912 RepID=L0H2D0_9GAMM|nr:P-loop NTPase fold protein [Thioflavicoccus mobilis]AGA92386.1 KAP family P-loop domain protein [Thioflavicoccus mobilis 8321]